MFVLAQVVMKPDSIDYIYMGLGISKGGNKGGQGRAMTPLEILENPFICR